MAKSALAAFVAALWRRQTALLAGLALVGSLCGTNPATAAERRVALVIGIAQYNSVASLANPGRDATRVAQSLRQVGFEVTELTNPAVLSRGSIVSALSAFRRAATGADAAIIYYAGHGVELGGRNFLLPADAKAETPDDLEGTAIASSLVTSAVSGATTVRLVILDACRDNPFAKEPGWSTGQRAIATTRGLARESSLPGHVMLLLATQPGTRANDGNGSTNSPFAQALATSLTMNGMRLSSLPSMISKQMRLIAGIDQSPDQQGIIDEPDWMFRPGSGGVTPPAPTPAASLATTTAPPAPSYSAVTVPSAPVISAAGYGMVLQSRGDGQSGVIVAQISGTSPFAGKVYPNDVILKLDGVGVVQPGRIIGALQQDGRAALLIQHNGAPIMKTLELQKASDD